MKLSLPVISLRPELERLASDGNLSEDQASFLIAIEDREIVSVHALLRFLLWAGVAIFVGGAGLWFTENLDQLGPAVVTIVGAVLAASAYGAAIWMDRRSKSPYPPLAVDYLGLLGALLLSADVAWAESQFAILANWTHHLLILAAVHAAFAYAMRNRLVLAVSVTSLAAWFGVDQHDLFDLSGLEGGLRLLAAASTVLLWRLMHRFHPNERFEEVLEHATVHLYFWACLVWIVDERWQWLGLLSIAVVATIVATWIRRVEGKELQVVWTAIYSLIGVDIILFNNLDDDVLIFLWLTVSSLAAVFGLIAFFVRRRGQL